MAFTYQNANGLAPAARTSATSPLPTSISAGDLLIAGLFLVGDKDVTVSAGWNLITPITRQGVITVARAWRIATGSDSQPTFSWDGTSLGCQANVFRFNGVTFYSVAIGNYNSGNGSGTTAAAGAINATAASSIFWTSIETRRAADGQTIPLPSGWTNEQNSFGSANAFSNRTAHLLATNVGDSSGAVSVSVLSSDWTVQILEIRTQAPPASRTQCVVIT